MNTNDHPPSQTNHEESQPNHISKMDRRDFLRLASLLPITPLLDKICAITPSQQDQDKPNVIIILFDTLSARHLSLYGYPRETTPNLTKFAEKATVYHNHYAGGNFTVPGTASLLTGTYPWTNRAFNPAGKMTDIHEQRNIFHLFGDEYNRIAYPQNMWAHLLLSQLDSDIDSYIDPQAFSLFDDVFYSQLMSGDVEFSHRSVEDLLFANKTSPGSLFLSLMSEIKTLIYEQINQKKLEDLYPRGIPNFAHYGVYFLLEDVIKGTLQALSKARQPFLAYLHFFSPHGPYRPRYEFVDIFYDDWTPLNKEQHIFSRGLSAEFLNEQRLWYDEYIANVDAEFGRLYDAMKENGLVRNSYIVLTSDHGELFERGVCGHFNQLLYEPIIHVPLLISKPDQRRRQDVHTPTSCVDLLPTLLHAVGRPIPSWCEGQVLPGFGGMEDSSRSVFSVEAKENPARTPLRQGTVAMIQGRHKLIHYFGYPSYKNEYEFYDLESDPEELHNLYASAKSIAFDMQNQLEEKLREVNRPYL